jgi:hypothetical protein
VNRDEIEYMDVPLERLRRYPGARRRSASEPGGDSNAATASTRMTVHAWGTQ